MFIKSSCSTDNLISYRNFCDQNKKDFAARLNSIIWASLKIDESVDQINRNFSGILTENFHACFPICYKKKAIDTDKPYVDASLKKSLRRKKDSYDCSTNIRLLMALLMEHVATK